MVRGLFLVLVSGNLPGMRTISLFTAVLCHLVVVPGGQCWGLDPSFLSLCPGLLRSGHSLEVFPCSLLFLQSCIISLGPLYSTFSAKDKDKEGSSTILSLKKVYFYQQYMHMFYKIKF